jgi:hypothetical protein
MDASQAGVGSQIFDAILKGTGVKDTSKRVAEVFALNGQITRPGNEKAAEATKAAQTATEESIALLTGPTGRKRTDDDIAKLTSDDGKSMLLGVLNKQIAAGRETAKAYGKTEDAAAMKDIQIQGTPEEQGRALQGMMKTLKHAGYESADEAKQDLENLRAKEKKQGAPLEGVEGERLRALNTLSPIITNQKGFDVMKKGKFDLRSLAAAAPAAHADRLAHYELEQTKDSLINNAGQQLEQIAKKTPLTAADKEEQANLNQTLSQYRDKKTGKVDYKRMYDEYQHKSGYFEKLDDKKRKSLDEGSFGTKMQSVTKLMEQEQDKLAASGAAKEDPLKTMGASVDALKESVDKLNTEISAGGGMAAAITTLANNLSTMLNTPAPVRY